MTNKELWQAALSEIELSISKANFITWFENTSIVSNENGEVVIGVPNGFAKEWLENKYNLYILKALKNLQEDIREISCVICSSSQAGAENKIKTVDAVHRPDNQGESVSRFSSAGGSIEPPFRSHPIYPEETASGAYQSGQNTPRTPFETNLNPRYTFEKFIIGEYNELARAACFAVSQNLGKVYNPLFIYGGVGLGKTHLLQSIGNEVLRHNPEKKIRYITSERFTNELIDAIRSQHVDHFKKEYQDIDLLIIDDVQFLSGKEKTQLEFFNIFNVLYQLDKQIVISSDRLPKAIQTLEDRLRSRFEGGMVIDVGIPDVETRMAILRAKAAERSFHPEDEVIKFIAENVKSNVRELEGALNRVIASCEFNREQPTAEYAKQVLAEIISSGKKKGIGFKHVVKAITDFYEITEDDLTRKGRKKEVVVPRQIAMYLLRTEMGASYPWIGSQFGGRDHTTAIHAYEKIDTEIKNNNEKLKEELAVLRDKIYRL